MPKEFVQKLALYSILPCLLAFSAIFLNGLFQPQLQWKINLLESQGEKYRIEYQEISTTDLFSQPRISAASKEGYACGVGIDWVYAENQLRQDRSILESQVKLNNDFAYGVAFLAVFNVVIRAVYLLKQKTGWVEVFVILTLAAISAIALITFLGPLSGRHFYCWTKIKVEADLIKISYDGVIYAFIGALTAILTVVLMIARYFQKPKFTQTDVEISA